MAKKKYILRKHKGTFYVATVEQETPLPENRKLFNHCGECGNANFRENKLTYACKKCKAEYGKKIWRYER